MRLDVVSLIILYNPKLELLYKNIEACLSQVDKVYLVDNSENLIEYNFHSEKIEYYRLGQNFGIAYALNFGFKKIIQENYSWCITLDQDSILPINFTQTCKKCLKDNSQNDIGIIAPFFSGQKIKKKETQAYILKKEVITSGAFTNVKAYQKVGGFKDEYFIDAVDFEFCWHLRCAGYKIIQISDLTLQHNLGIEGYDIKLFNTCLFKITNHSPLRRYYMIRNSLFLSDEYKKIFPKESKKIRRKFFTNLTKIVFFEKNKIKKIRFMVRGIKDYRKKITGKYAGSISFSNII